MPPGSTEKKPTTDRRPLIMTATDGRCLELCLTETELSPCPPSPSLKRANRAGALFTKLGEDGDRFGILYGVDKLPVAICNIWFP